MRAHAGERLHQPRLHAPVVGRARVPGGDVGVTGGQRRTFADDAQRLLAPVHLGAVRVPTHVEAAAVAVDPSARRVVRRVAGLERQVQEERLVQAVGAQLVHPAEGGVREVRGQVVAGLQAGRLAHRPVVQDHVRVPRAGLPAHEAIKTLEAAA